MKRYLLFCGDNYYPGGGWEDFVGAYDTIRECILVLVDQHSDWYQVVDSQIMREIRIENEPYS